MLGAKGALPLTDATNCSIAKQLEQSCIFTIKSDFCLL